MIREEDLRELVSEDGCLYTSDVTKAGIRREELARFVKTEVGKMLEKSDKAELLIDNTDLGVG